MPETRAISERIDLRYVRKRRWPHTWLWVGAVGMVGVVLVLGAGTELLARAEGVYAHSFYSSGTLTKAHAMFGSDCGACHRAAVGDRGAGALFLPVLDDACLACHESRAATHNMHQAMFQGGTRRLSGMSQAAVMSGSCAACHIEHRGRDYDLRKLDDGVCVKCHSDLNAFGFAQGKARAPGDAQGTRPASAPAAAPAAGTAPTSTPPATTAPAAKEGGK